MADWWSVDPTASGTVSLSLHRAFRSPQQDCGRQAVRRLALSFRTKELKNNIKLKYGSN